MSLKEDLNAGLEAISAPNSSQKLMLDESGCCHVPVPMPASVIDLADGRLIVEIRVSGTGKFFTLSSPLAIISGTPSRDFLESLFYRQFYADQVSGASFAINTEGEKDVLVAIYHWMLDSITPNDLSSLFKGFVAAVFNLIEEMDNIARREQSVQLIHKGRFR